MWKCYVGRKREDMTTYDMQFDFYGYEPPKYFERPTSEFDGYDPIKEGEETEGM